jgi:FkbM family methyltransferase
MKSVSGAPLMLRAVRSMQRSHIRGASFLMRRLHNLGALNVIAQYQVGSVKFSVPLYRLPWDFLDVEGYEAKLIRAFCRAVEPLNNVTLFDCGGDIGTFSSLVCSRTDKITRVVAFEPNPDVFNFLKLNLSNLPIVSEIVPKGVSSFTGFGRLERADYDPSDHARFLVPGDGPIEVTKIDSMNVRGGDVAIKLDIEGGELEALKGAAETITSARECVVTMEAHPLVAKRTGQDPIECLRFLQSLRPFRFLIAETGESPSMTATVVKSGQSDNLNVVGWTHSHSLIY